MFFLQAIERIKEIQVTVDKSDPELVPSLNGIFLYLIRTTQTFPLATTQMRVDINVLETYTLGEAFLLENGGRRSAMLGSR